MEPREGWLLTKRKKLILLVCSIDVWNLYLHVRQLEFIVSNSTVPDVLKFVIQQENYDILRRQAAFLVLVNIFGIASRLQCNANLLKNEYPRWLWEKTGIFTSDPNMRPVIFSAIDVIISKWSVIPMVVVLSITQNGLKVSPVTIALAGVVWLVSEATFTALNTHFLVHATNQFGMEVFLQLAIVWEAVSIVGHAVFIHFLAPYALTELPEGPYKTSINMVAERVRYYPRHGIYLEPNVEGRPESDPNAYQAGVLGASMIVVSETLMKLVGPQDIAAVIAHELGHWYYNHSLYGLISQIFRNFLIIYSAMYSYGNQEVFGYFGFSDADPPHPLMGIHLCSKYFSPLSNGFVQGLRGVVSYSCEFAADRFAVTLDLGDGLRRSLINVVSKISVFPPVDAWYAAWFRGHPSIVRRIEGLP